MKAPALPADAGPLVRQVEIFTVRHRLNPRTGPSIAYFTEHAYALVKVTDDAGHAGWGETYLFPGTAAVLEALARGLVGASTGALRTLRAELRLRSEHIWSASALTIALEDLRARQLGISVAALLGGPLRSSVRAYAASGGYIEGRDPADTWPAEVARIRAAGFSAMKFRIGRFPIAHEARLLEQIRSGLPDEFQLMADGNAAYTFPRAMEMSHVLARLGFRWFEEPMHQREGYAGYEQLRAALPLALAAGEVLQGRGAARDFLNRSCAHIIQQDPVICGGLADALWIADLAALQGVPTIPHASNNAIGLAANLQLLACLPNPTRSAASDELYLEIGVDDNPHRAGLLASPLEFRQDVVTIPSGPGLGITINEDYLRKHATSIQLVDRP